MDIIEQLQNLPQERKDQIIQQLSDEQTAQKQLDSQAKQLALDLTQWMVEHHTSKVTISNTYDGYLEIGDWEHGHKPQETTKKFHVDVVKAMVAFLNKQDGFSAKFQDAHFPECYAGATVEMS